MGRIERRYVRIRTVDGESLEQGPDDHQDGAEHDAPPAAIVVVDEGDERKTDAGTKRERRGKDALVPSARMAKV